MATHKRHHKIPLKFLMYEMSAMETLLQLGIKCILMSRNTAHLNTFSLGALHSPHNNHLSCDFLKIPDCLLDIIYKGGKNKRIVMSCRDELI